MKFREKLLEKTEAPIVSSNALRTLIGVLGMLLPALIIVYAFALIPRGYGLECSISAYYHTQMRDVLVCILCATGLFMMTYNGYEKRDTIASFIAGFFALGVAFFPTSDPIKYGLHDTTYTLLGLYKYISTGGAATVPGTNFTNFIGKIHIVMASGLFIMFAIMSIFLFTLSSLEKPERKKRHRNVIYRLCGWTIVACIALILLNDVAMIIPDSLHPTFWFEMISLIAFGFSWLVKGEAIKWLNDPKTKPAEEPADEVVLKPA